MNQSTPTFPAAQPAALPLPAPCDHRDYQAGDIAGCATCVALATAAAPRVTATVRGPLDFGVSARGTTFESCFDSILSQMQGMRDAGLIGTGALVGAGHALLDVAQDGEVAA